MSLIETLQFSSRIRFCAEKLAQQGVGALGDLYDLTAARILRYAMTVTRNRADAEDAVQAAMVRIALKPQKLSEAISPWAYLLKVVRNEAIKIIRQKRAFPCPKIFAVEDHVDLQTLDQDELKQFVQTALRRLPPAQSEVVVLKVWEEMTFLEIAEVLGESHNTVASRYRYALEKLTHHLESFCDEVPYV